MILREAVSLMEHEQEYRSCSLRRPAASTMVNSRHVFAGASLWHRGAASQPSRPLAGRHSRPSAGVLEERRREASAVRIREAKAVGVGGILFAPSLPRPPPLNPSPPRARARGGGE